jgi:hypothetical protein
MRRRASWGSCSQSDSRASCAQQANANVSRFDSNEDKNDFKQSLKSRARYKRHAALQCDRWRNALTKVTMPVATLTFSIDLR